MHFLNIGILFNNDISHEMALGNRLWAIESKVESRKPERQMALGNQLWALGYLSQKFERLERH